MLKDDTTIIEQEIVTVTHTEEGDELAKLGRGLGPTTNGVACSECHGVGYRTVHQLAVISGESGWHVERSWTNRSQTCHGIMVVMGKNIECYTCTKCGGKGELPMWNPVLPRGLLIGNGG